MSKFIGGAFDGKDVTFDSEAFPHDEFHVNQIPEELGGVRNTYRRRKYLNNGNELTFWVATDLSEEVSLKKIQALLD